MSIQRHTAYNLAGGVLPLALSLVTIPLYIRVIGDARYGVLAIAWLLLGYFGLFDLGLSTATAQRIAALPEHSQRERSEVFCTALIINAGLGILGGLLILPVAIAFFSRSTSIAPLLRPEIAAALPWLVLAVPLATISGVLTGALQGRARFLELNVISVSGAVLIQVFPLTVARLHGPDLAWLLPAVVCARLLIMIALLWRCSAHVIRRADCSFSTAQASTLLRFGGWVTVSSTISPFMVMLDRFVIGALLGPKAVTHYTVPFQLAERTLVFPGALVASLFPRMASADPMRARTLAYSGIRALAVVMTPVTAVMLLGVRPFLTWWLSPEFAALASIPGQLLLLGFWVNAFALVPYSLLQAALRPDLVAKCHIFEIIPYLLLMYLGLHFFGTAGAAFVFGVRTLVDCLILMRYAGVLAFAVRALAIPTILLLITYAFVQELQPQLAWGWSIAGACTLVVAAIGSSYFMAPSEVRAAAGRLARFATQLFVARLH